MEAFSNSVITVFLGWIKGVCGALYDSVTANGTGGLLGWLGRNWIVLTVLLLLFGTVIDLFVYFMRWRTLDVWKSYFRRIRRHREEARAGHGHEEAPADGARMIWADGSSAPLPPEDMPEPEPADEPAFAEETPPQQPDEQPLRVRRSDRYKNSRVSLLKEGIRAISMNDDPDDGTLIAAYKPQMNTDRSLNFHAPVYPQQTDSDAPQDP